MKILIADDEKECCDTLKHFLSRISLDEEKEKVPDITCSYDGREALELLNKKSFDMLICDVNLPGASGFEIYNEAMKSGKTQVILISGREDMIEASRALFEGRAEFFPKPVDLKRLIETVKKYYRKRTGGA